MSSAAHLSRAATPWAEPGSDDEDDDDGRTINVSSAASSSSFSSLRTLLFLGVAIAAGGGSLALVYPSSIWGTEGVLFVQSFASLDRLMVWASWVGDPGWFLHAILPFLLGLHGRNNCSWSWLLSTMAVFVLADASNAWLKWPLQGDRPYWVDPRVRQFPATCEVGFGNPSGHVMVTSTVWLLLGLRFRLAGLWVVVAALLPAVAWSRAHTGSHMIDQCIGGLLAGIAYAVTAQATLLSRDGGAWWLRRVIVKVVVAQDPDAEDAEVAGGEGGRRGGQRRRRRQRRRQCSSSACGAGFAPVFAAAAASALLAAVTWLEAEALERVLGMDPHASVRRAEQACRIQGGTAATVGPFRGIARDAGAMLGVAAAIGWAVATQDWDPLDETKWQQAEGRGAGSAKGGSAKGGSAKGGSGSGDDGGNGGRWFTAADIVRAVIVLVLSATLGRLMARPRQFLEDQVSVELGTLVFYAAHLGLCVVCALGLDPPHEAKIVVRRRQVAAGTAATSSSSSTTGGSSRSTRAGRSMKPKAE